MNPVQGDSYNRRSTTMNQFAQSGQQLMNTVKNPYPFTNANLLPDYSSKLSSEKSGNDNSVMQQQYGDDREDYFDHELSNKKDFSINNMSTKLSALKQAERREEHNAVERARRVSLNAKFQSLAQLLPNLTNHRRPSKSLIVEKAFDWVKQHLSKEEIYRYQICQLQKENKTLLVQLMPQQQQSSSTAGMVTAAPQQSISAPTTKTKSTTPYNASSSGSSSSGSSYPLIMYTSSSAPTDCSGWSTHAIQHPQIHSNEDLLMTTAVRITKQGLASSNDYEDNASCNGSEDETDYQSPPSTFIGKAPPQRQQQFLKRRKCLTRPEAHPIEFPASESYFNPAFSRNQKYATRVVNNGVNLGPGHVDGDSQVLY